MNSLRCVAVSLLALCTAAFGQSPISANETLKHVAPTPAADYAKLPLSFEANQGQIDPGVRFVSRGNGYSLFLTDKTAVLALTKTDRSANNKLTRQPIVGKAAAKPASPPKIDVVRMELAGASRGIRVEGAERLPGTANYFIGNDPAKWHTSVPTYAEVKYSGVYPGVDLVYYGNQRQLEYDFVVAPGADPKMVKLHFAGAKRLTLNANGDLIIAAKNGEIAFHKPAVYQAGMSQRDLVDGRFVLLAGNAVGFRLGSYDKSRELVIDPVLGYSTYLGGSDGDGAYGIAVDDLGYTYVTGYTYSTDFPVTTGAFQTTNEQTANKDSTAFVSKINPAGSALVYSTFLGGSGVAPPSGAQPAISEYGSKVAVDASGNAYVVGNTNSADFPVTEGAFQTVNKDPNGSVFVTKLNATGTALIYSTFLSGSGEQGSLGDIGNGIAVDASGHAYVTGWTPSPDFPVTTGAFQTINNAVGSGKFGTFNAFVTKINAAGSALDYSTFLGGSGSCCGGDSGNGIAIDTAGHAYLVGSTYSSDFPVTTGAFQTTNKAYYGSSNVFVTKLNPSGSALDYSTFLGGSGTETASDLQADAGYGIAIDSAGNAYVTGSTFSSDFPVTTGAFQTANNGTSGGVCCSNLSPNAFVTKLNPSGSALVYSTYLGGTGYHAIGGDYPGSGDVGSSITLDASGHASVTGSTVSLDFPVTAGSFQTTKHGASYVTDAFLTKLNDAGTSLLYSTFLGGSGNGDCGTGYASDIVSDSYQNVYLAGATCSNDFPVTPGAFQTTNHAFANETSNAFVTKFYFNTTTTALTSTPNPSAAGQAVTFTATVKATDGDTPTGTVTFTHGGVPYPAVTLSGGVAAYTTSAQTVGTHSIQAMYSGSATDAKSSSAMLNQVVLNATSTALTSSANPATSGEAVTLTATVTAASGAVPTGTVSFSTASGLLDTATLSGGVATYTTSALSVATHHITATYSGSGTDAVSDSAVLAQVVQAAPVATTTTITSSANPSTSGETVIFTAKVTASSGATPTGTVSFSSASGVLGTATLSGGMATYTTSSLSVATHHITATYSGSGTDAASESAVLSQVVNQ